jgi:DNA-directed RNA polymerase specialized sigma24 family protein
MTDHPAILKYAAVFARTTGMDYKDVLQEARIAYHKAERAIATGQYDPRKSSFDTFATNCVYHSMCNLYAKHKRHPPVMDELDETIMDHTTPPPDRGLLLAQLIRDLPDDARAIVNLVLSDAASDLVDRVLSGADGAVRRLKRYIRRELGLRRGDRAEAAFTAISKMLGEISV